MDFITPDFVPALPEIFVVASACIILIVDLFLTDSNRVITYLLSQATLLGAAVLTVSLITTQPQLTFNDTFINDSMGNILKRFVSLGTASVFVYSREFLAIR